MSFSSTNNHQNHNSNNNDNMANSSSDFVSADVNEVTQEAQQILTNREQPHDGQHPNELDESTTVQVTKQDSDKDPLEVTVLQKRLVKQEEAEAEDPGNEEDDVQLKVEITEQCRQQEGKGTNFVEQMIAVTSLALAAIVVSFWDKLYRPLRARIFSCIGLNVTEEMTMDLPRPRHRKLPAELDREIFLFLKPAAQRKFIWGLNWDFYAMFRYRLLTKSKRVCNTHGNRWNGANTMATVAVNGLNIRNQVGAVNVFAEQPFPISGPLSRMDDFPGTICYYYEIKANISYVGLSYGAPNNSWLGIHSNSYALLPYLVFDRCWLAGEHHHLQLPEGVVRPKWKCNGNVFGCGLVLDPKDKLAIFFTLNGKLLGRKIPISPTVDRLFPSVTMMWEESSIEANFGDDPAKPFVYDIQKCTGLELACI